MDVQRRSLLRLMAVALAGMGAGLTRWRTLAQGPSLALRTVTNADAGALEAMMTSCVTGADAFHGECHPWSREWAERTIARCPGSIVITRNAVPAAFMEVPRIRAEIPPISSSASASEREKHALRELNRGTMRLTAAGVRGDLVGFEESVELFRRVLYYGFRAAREQGFEHGQCYAPWDQHPRMPRRWTEYPSCALVEQPSFSQTDGRALYWLRWRLSDVIAALEAEGAGAEQLDVA